MQITAVKKLADGDDLMTVTYWSGWLWWRKLRTFWVTGSCTVWYYYPSGRRCGADTEWELIQARKGWNNLQAGDLR
jgi:hypothetical protein